MIFSNFLYKIVYIKGEDNCLASLLSRRGTAETKPEHGNSRKLRKMRLAAFYRVPVAPELDPDFTWPSINDILASPQYFNEEERMIHQLQSDEGVSKFKGIFGFPVTTPNCSFVSGL